MLIGIDVTRTAEPKTGLGSYGRSLLAAMAQFDVKAAQELLEQGVPEYNPTGGIVDLLWGNSQASHSPVPVALESNVTSIQSRRGAGSQS